MKSFTNAWVLLGVVVAGFLAGCQCDEATTESVAPDFQISGSPPWVTASGGQVAVNFGDVLVGQTKSVEIKVSNKGDYVLEITKAELAAGTSTEFAYNVTIPLKLEPQKESAISLAYTPAAPGPDSGSVVLTTNVGEGKQYPIGVSGNGVQPDIEVCIPEQAKCNDDNETELALDFGQIALGESVGSKQVAVKNVGSYPLNVKDAVVLSCPWDKPDCAFVDMVAPSEPEFLLEPASISGTYVGGAEMAVGVTYKPMAGGATKSALRITSDDADELEVWVILRGTGIAPRLCPQPPVSLDFGSVQIGNHVDKEFVFTSCGTQPLEVTTVAFAASNTAEFSWTDGTAPEVPVTLDPGESMTLKIRYLPVDVGEDIGRVEIESKDPTAPKGYVDLRGEGTEGPTCNLQASPTTLSFVNIKAGSVGKKNVSLTNVGDAPCSVSSMARISGTDKNEFYLDPAPA
ncbi:MAG: choice-of-anchor D domain-containing protein, partial [Deltaproteobacteria bacterium]|nr:choice-of-anchor D domain-containing protein [Deltaproteobacteria bacterium]